MKKTQNRPNDFYYFVENTVIYEISSKQDFDSCAAVGKDNWYTDGEFDEDKAAKILPYIKLTYKKQSDGTTGTKYLWLDNLIADGDVYSNSKFSPNPTHYSGKKYIDVYLDSIDKDIVDRIVKGNSYGIDIIIKSKDYYPGYIIGNTPYEDVIDGEIVTVTNVVSSDGNATFNRFSDSVLYPNICKYCGEAATDTVNGILDVIKKKLKTPLTVSASNVVDK